MADVTTVDDLIQLVREDVDESNVADITDAFILKKLNRAQRRAVNRVVKRYDELFLTETGTDARADVTTVADQIEYDLPSDIYGTRLENVAKVEDDGSIIDLARTRKQASYKWSSTQATGNIRRYCLVHREYHILPKPTAGLTLRLTYTRLPETLVEKQGRIVSSGTDSGTGLDYVVVDTLGDDLATAITDDKCYVNIINPRTGAVRGSVQIASINTTTKTVYFKASGLTKSSVLGKTISTSLPSATAAEDYICTVHGTCISEIPEAYIDYLTQHTTVTIKRLKGEPTSEDYSELMALEKDLDTMWAGLESRKQIRQKFRSRYSIMR